jgi:hypothetical protein
LAHEQRVANNKLLSKLPAKDRARFLSACAHVELPFKELITQSEDPIRYKRGSVAVLDRRGLEEAACGCYRVNLDTYRRVLG